MSFRSISTNNNHNTTLVVTAPSGIADGDVLIAWAVNDTYNTAPGLPAGFTAFTPSLLTTNVDACTIVAGYKVASSESGNYTLTSGASEIVGGVACFTGIDTTTVPYRIISQTDNSSAGSPYDVTTGAFTGGNTDTTCDLIFLLGDDVYVTGSTHTGPSGYTVRADVVSTDGNSQTFAIATQDAVASGVTGAATMSATTTNTSFGRMAYHFALKNTTSAIALNSTDGVKSGDSVSYLVRPPASICRIVGS